MLMPQHTLRISPVLVAGSLALLTAVAIAAPTVVRVNSIAELRAAARAAGPGTRIELAPGIYEGGLYLENLQGEKGMPIVIAGVDPKTPPHLKGGRVGIHLVNPFFVELRDLTISGAGDNGISIDDGGKYTPKPRGLVLDQLRVTDIGPRGNHDGIKLSGIDGFHIENCVIERWGIESGGGIDMVGCHDGLIVSNHFQHHADPAKTGGTGIQAKGGTKNIVIRQNSFEHAGARSLNLGGSTGLQFFRPPLDQWPEGEPRYEASDITVEGNTFIGSTAPFAFVGINHAVVRYNTVYVPGKWAMRILQENKEPGFVASRCGVISNNIFVFRSDQWTENGVNLGPDTAPDTFRFTNNLWFCIDRPETSKPRLPTPEVDGVYGVDPQLRDPTHSDLRVKPGSPAQMQGIDAYRQPR